MGFLSNFFHDLRLHQDLENSAKNNTPCKGSYDDISFLGISGSNAKLCHGVFNVVEGERTTEVFVPHRALSSFGAAYDANETLASAIKEYLKYHDIQLKLGRSLGPNAKNLNRLHPGMTFTRGLE